MQQQAYSEQIRIEHVLFDLSACISELSQLQSALSNADCQYLHSLNQQIRKIFTGGNHAIS